MSEYKSRRERRRARGGSTGAGHPMAHKGPPMVMGAAKKRKEGGVVEGEKARSHLGKRARGGSAGAKQLDAREAALSSDGVDKVAKGFGREEREVPVQTGGGGAKESADTKMKQQYLARPPKFGVDADYERKRGGACFADGGAPKYEVDDDESEDKGELTPPKRASENKYTTDERAKGGWIGPARERMERKGTVGSLHKALHVPEGEKIPEKRLESAAKHASGKLAKKIQFAENVRK